MPYMPYQAAPLYPMHQTLGSVSSQPWPPNLTDTTEANDDLSGFAVHKALAPAAQIGIMSIQGSSADWAKSQKTRTWKFQFQLWTWVF